MEEKICQSCGMHLNDAGFFGTNADESRNEDYCIYCYAFGDFTEDFTIDEMVEQYAEMMANQPGALEEEATQEELAAKMKEKLSTLKRWAQ